MNLALLVPAAALAVFVYFMANRGWHGGGKWFLLSFATALVMVFVVPHVPGSPISCIAQRTNCKAQHNALDWAFLICLLPAIIGTWGKERG